MSAHLFNVGDFVLHSGAPSHFKIDCAALTDDDLDALAVQVAARLHWRSTWAIPEGGTRFARALQRFNAPVPLGVLPDLIVDDVLTTGGSMEAMRASLSMPTIGVVIFARSRPAPWITPLFLAAPDPS